MIKTGSERYWQDMKKYRTNNIFDKENFARVLNSIGVKAYVGADGIIFDDIAFAEIPTWTLPDIVRINNKFMTSTYHTEDITE